MSFEEELPEGWKYSKYRMELYCPHGVGHPVPWSKKSTHGCCRDRCCDPDSDSKWQEALEVLENYIDFN